MKMPYVFQIDIVRATINKEDKDEQYYQLARRLTLPVDSSRSRTCLRCREPAHGSGLQRSHASAGQPDRPEGEDQLGPTTSQLGQRRRRTAEITDDEGIKYMKAWQCKFVHHGFNLDKNDETPFKCVPNALFKCLVIEMRAVLNLLHLLQIMVLTLLNKY
jgi:hypothetical protein